MIAVKQVLIIAMLIAIGYYLAKKKVFTEKTGKELSYLLVNFVTPSLILNSFQIDYTPEKLQSLLTTLLLAFLSYIVIIAVSYIYCGRGEENKIERLAITFSNTGFMGIPLIAGMYGEEGVFYASIMVIMFNVMFWTYGISVVKGKFSASNIKKIVFSPTIIAVVLGLAFFIFHIRLPEPLYLVTKHLSNLNTPVAMMVAGISISQSNLVAMLKNTKMYKILFGKLILAPVVAAGLFMLIPAPVIIKEILTIQVACPVAAIIGISLLQNNIDSRSVTEYFSFTTLASMLTIPLIKMLCEVVF